eukprot:CAMPEP_0185257224 /NCGR_PEP_ID=MMETSP1359-20130426/6286_1 /TAXON_ID=552665 /ORGANISM="Bigelowiella longifila, Strain CCMP242" /LENGTH=187 /DNA_ID=CAMNT_0027842201 /DNA_START=257 /DNA_END=821 /DNA_ORIENTATION=-
MMIRAGDLHHSLTRGDRFVVDVVATEIHLARTHNDVFRVVQEFVPVREPAGGAGNGEEDGEEIGWESHCLVDQPRVEIHIGVELALDKEWIGKSDFLEFLSDFDHGLFAGDAEYIVSELSDDSGPRVVVLVHPVPKTHQPDLLSFNGFDEIRDVLLVPNLLEHFQNSLVRSSVTWADNADAAPPTEV